MSLAPGTRIGPYEVVSMIGAGGMGEVYRARDTRLGRDVALKILPHAVATDPERRTRFEREARAVAALSHPNILAIHDYGTSGTLTYVVMELLEGETLRGRLLKGRLSWREATGVAAAIADGLDAAHGKGIVHRDLKPENVFLTTDGRVKILDFGIARVVATAETETQPAGMHTAANAVLGTAAYMSPEQIRGEPVGAASDLFSLGCVLHEMLTGVRPFAGQTPAEIMTSILHDDPPRLSTARTIPIGLDRIVGQCLEKDIARRFHSAHDLGLALRQIYTESGASATARLRRRPVVIAVTFVAAGVLLAVAATWVRTRSTLAGRRTVPIDSIAVLPLVNASGDSDLDYLGDGLTEALINRLSQLPDLRVIARTTAFRYKNKAAEPGDVGRVLGVQAVVMGQVTRRVDIVSVQLDLVNTTDGSQLWGEQFRLSGNDVDPLHSRAPGEIAERLRRELTRDQERRLAKGHTHSIEAYRLYLRGRQLLHRYDPDAAQRALQAFEEATILDPAYALAYSGRADAFSFLGNFNHMEPGDAYRQARTAALKALDLDDELAEAHTSLARIRMNHDWDWVSAEKGYQRALELNPGNATAHSLYAWLMAAQGRLDDAVERMRHTLQLDPLSVKENANFGWYLYMARRYDEAIGQLQKTLELDASDTYAHQLLGRVYEQQERYPEAIAELRDAVARSSRGSTELAALGHAYGMAERDIEARKILTELQQLGQRKYVSPYNLAIVHAGLRELDPAFALLARAYEQRDGWLAGHVNVDPRFDPLRPDPRFNRLLRRIGLSPFSANTRPVTKADQ